MTLLYFSRVLWVSFPDKYIHLCTLFNAIVVHLYHINMKERAILSNFACAWQPSQNMLVRTWIFIIISKSAFNLTCQTALMLTIRKRFTTDYNNVLAEECSFFLSLDSTYAMSSTTTMYRNSSGMVWEVMLLVGHTSGGKQLKIMTCRNEGFTLYCLMRESFTSFHFSAFNGFWMCFGFSGILVSSFSSEVHLCIRTSVALVLYCPCSRSQRLR